MTSSREAKDTLIVIAFPDFYIYYPDTWHRPISHFLGIAKGNRVLAGHNCALLIEYATGQINYFDFGRYAVPQGKGRARSTETDPELKIELKAKFSNQNQLLNLGEIIAHFAEQETIHHGAGPLFYKVVKDIHGNRIKSFVEAKTKLGFIPYEIFGMKSLNCSRYIYQLIKHVIPSERLTTYFKYFCPSATPLDNVMHIDISKPIYKYTDCTHEQLMYNWFDSITYYFKNRKSYHNNTSRIDFPDLKWIGSNAIGSYFKLESEDESSYIYHLLKYDQSGTFIWKKRYMASAMINLNDYSIQLGNEPDHFRVVSNNEVLDLILKNS